MSFSYMADPLNITDYSCSEWELQRNLLFWIAVAGKKALRSASSLNSLLVEGNINFGEEAPFSIIIAFGESLSERMKFHGMGCYNDKSFYMRSAASSGLDLAECSISDLESISGVGPKTARCFLMHTRKGSRYAGLDTHILKYMSSRGIKVPKSTPTGRTYAELEEKFLLLADQSGMSVADFDLKIWKEYSVGKRRTGRQSN